MSDGDTLCGNDLDEQLNVWNYKEHKACVSIMTQPNTDIVRKHERMIRLDYEHKGPLINIYCYDYELAIKYVR